MPTTRPVMKLRCCISVRNNSTTSAIMMIKVTVS